MVDSGGGQCGTVPPGQQKSLVMEPGWKDREGFSMSSSDTPDLCGYLKLEYLGHFKFLSVLRSLVMDREFVCSVSLKEVPCLSGPHFPQPCNKGIRPDDHQDTS